MENFTVTAAEFQKNFGKYRDVAQREAVAVTNYGRESVVLISAAEYARYLKATERQAQYAWEIPQDEMDLIAAAEPPAEAELYNDEVL